MYRVAWHLLHRSSEQFGCSLLNNARSSMTAETLVGLLEEMVDLKIQQYAESTMRPSPEVARILYEKKETDRRRMDQIRSELIRILKG